MIIVEYNHKITERIYAREIQFYTNGDLKGYINGLVYDTETNRDYEVLYRVHDPQNGSDYDLVSVDYGWKLNDDNEITKIEKFLTAIAKKNNYIDLL